MFLIQVIGVVVLVVGLRVALRAEAAGAEGAGERATYSIASAQR